MGFIRFDVVPSAPGQIPVKIMVYRASQAQMGIVNGRIEIRLGDGIEPGSLPTTLTPTETTETASASLAALTVTQAIKAGPLTIPMMPEVEDGNNWTVVTRKRRGRKLTRNAGNGGEGGVGEGVGEVEVEIEQDEYARKRSRDFESEQVAIDHELNEQALQRERQSRNPRMKKAHEQIDRFERE